MARALPMWVARSRDRATQKWLEIMNPMEQSVDLGSVNIKFETGKLAKQSSGSVWVTCGGTANQGTPA